MKIGIIESNPDSLKYLSEHLAQNYGDIETVNAISPEELYPVLDKIAIIFINIKLANDNNCAALKGLNARKPGIIVIVLLEYNTNTRSIIEVLKTGAYDCIEPPWNTSHVEHLIRSHCGFPAVKTKAIILPDEHEIIGKSQSADEIRKYIKKIAASNMPVLIEGESGVGKGIAAMAMHKNSRRAHKPFISVNCSALPRELLENELFGHEPGAFSGANTKKRGLFEVASEGTLFIDEIGDMDIVSQSKLLTVIETGKFRRLGGVEEIGTDVRVISATNRILQNEVAEKRFRLDLFYRLSVLKLYIPPLRERKEDVPLYAGNFIEKNYYGKKFDESAINALVDYAWPGNIRELYNVIKRACVFSEKDLITAQEIYPQLTCKIDDVTAGENTVTALSLSNDIGNVEKELIKKALSENSGNKSKAARALKVSRDTLYRKIRKYSL